MQYLDGEDLQQVIKSRRPLAVLQKLSIMSQVAEGLEAAHL
jgi:serine/threonine protein kinase